MKKLLSGLLVLGTLSSFTAPKAHAGLGVGIVTGAPATGTIIGASLGAAAAGYITLKFATETGNTGFGIFMGVVLGGPAFGALTLLDVDANLSRDHLTQFFQQQYPFIDSHEALSKLLDVVKGKISEAIQNSTGEKEVMVSLTYEEVAEALEMADLTNAQIEQIALDLK